MDIWAAIDQEREALVEDRALIDDCQRDAQSLCAEWKVAAEFLKDDRAKIGAV